MAVLIAPPAAETLCDAPDRSAAHPSGAAHIVVRLMTAPLPDDVPREEYTVAVLFRASLVLNFLTGGRPDMTFSARCHRAGRISRRTAQRMFWQAMARLIDTACAVLRGEREHCATAWANHRARKA